MVKFVKGTRGARMGAVGGREEHGMGESERALQGGKNQKLER